MGTCNHKRRGIHINRLGGETCSVVGKACLTYGTSETGTPSLKQIYSLKILHKQPLKRQS